MLEHLEGRRFFSISIIDRVLTVTGSGGADTMYAAWNNDGANSSVRVYDGSTSQIFTLASNTFSSVSMYGASGNDNMNGRRIMTGHNSYTTLLNTVVNGAAGADTCYGSDSADTLYGGSGNDALYSYGGDDSLRGEGGIDLLDGGSGDDILYGWESTNDADTLTGSTGLDEFWPTNTGGWSPQLIDILTDYNPTGEGDILTWATI